MEFKVYRDIIILDDLEIYSSESCKAGNDGDC